MTDFNEKGHTHIKRETARKMEINRGNQMKAKRFPSCETQLRQDTLEFQSLKPLRTTNGDKKKISGIGLNCALHKPSSIFNAWQEAAVYI